MTEVLCVGVCFHFWQCDLFFEVFYISPSSGLTSDSSMTFHHFRDDRLNVLRRPLHCECDIATAIAKETEKRRQCSMNFRSEIWKVTFVGWTFEKSQTTDCTHVPVHGRRQAILSPDERVKWNETSLHCLVLNHLQQIVHIWRSREGAYLFGGRLVCPDVSVAGSCKFPSCLMCVCVCAGCVLYDIQVYIYIYIYQ